MFIAAETRANHPACDCILPRIDTFQPGFMQLLKFSFAYLVLHLSRECEHRVYDYLWRIGFYCDSCRLCAKDMSQIPTGFKR
jgi:hypothetical protein